jgi:polyferredoxin/tetratricopeptide (TPR) repeat protein
MTSLPAGADRRCGSSISLPVLPGAGPAPAHPTHTLKKSRVAPWRAAVLVLVHVLMAAHIVLWLVSGMRDGVRETLSPVEPSESMYTLETGLVNAGFIFFAAAILSTFLFGRFFCGWGCHIVALQDLCGWLMKKCGVHPRPFRSRLLVFVPLVVALYMFVWPTFKREVLFKALAHEDPAVWQSRFGDYLGGVAQFPGWSNHLIVEDFWKTFAPWYVAIPFIFVCTFGVVYFLGNKGFCTYACPYAGFFGPADLVSIGKIKVNDSCEGCGHCTAVCSSNVRVHEEVRDFGMVVDPGCMKCMDCVSVCPNDALSFGFARPTLLKKKRSTSPRRARAFDLSWSGEIALALVFLALTMGFRGMLNEVPLLMALGMAGIGTFFTWKLSELVRVPSTRIHAFQLKLKGRLRPATLLFVPLALATLAAAGWSGWVKYTKWDAERTAAQLSVPAEILLRGGYTPDPQTRAIATAALDKFQRSGAVRNGGLGWRHRADDLQTIAYTQLVLGKYSDTEATLMEIMSRGRPLDALVLQLGNVMKLQGASDDAVVRRYEEVLAKQPQLSQVRGALAVHYAQSNRVPEAIRLYDEGLAARPGDPIVRKDYAILLTQLAGGQAPPRAMDLLRDATEIARGDRKGMRVRRDPESLRLVARAYAQVGRPELARPILEDLATLKRPSRPADILADLANTLYFMGEHDAAVETMKKASAENPANISLLANVAQMYDAMGRPKDSQEWARKFEEAQRRLSPPAPTPPGDR